MYVFAGALANVHVCKIRGRHLWSAPFALHLIVFKAKVFLNLDLVPPK